MERFKQSDTVPAQPYLRRLERLVTTLLRGQFETAEVLWQLQLDLLDLQRDIQERITQEKKIHRARRSSARLESLRWALWHSRRFGDALAWVLLGGDRKFIYPLAHNQRLSVLPDGHASRGLLAVAAEMANRGLGFPLLHDITDLLRVGDLTLIKPRELPQLVEVKTKLVGERRAEGGKKEFEYRVSAVWPEGLHTDPQMTGVRSHRIFRRVARCLVPLHAYAANFGE